MGSDQSPPVFFPDEISRHLSERHNVGPPVVNKQLFIRDVPEQDLRLLPADRAVGADRRQDVHLAAAGQQQVIIEIGDPAAVGLASRKIGRQQQNPVQGSAGQGSLEGSAEFILADSARAFLVNQLLHFNRYLCRAGRCGR
jgi:hypothetical protein